MRYRSSQDSLIFLQYTFFVLSVRVVLTSPSKKDAKERAYLLQSQLFYCHMVSWCAPRLSNKAAAEEADYHWKRICAWGGERYS